MKKYLIIGIIVLLVASMVLKPLFSNKDADGALPVQFDFKENLATTFNQKVPIKILINSSDVVQLDVLCNDSIIKTWKNPSEEVNFVFNTSIFGLGTRPLEALVTLSDGTKLSDKRLVRTLSDKTPIFSEAVIVNTFPHLTTNFTQGLEFDGNTLFESTGQRGESKVGKVDLTTGNFIDFNSLDATYFGEGMTILGNKLYQITWQEQKCFVYDKNNLKVETDFAYTGEGWGLCNDGKSLIMSDGSERLVFRNPENFQIDKTIFVYDNQGPIAKLNELEYIEGKIYANVWMTNRILVIDPKTGKVESIINADKLEQEGKGTAGDVLNGIAYNKVTKKIYLTGKRWDKLFEIKVSSPGI